jgi:endonuclease/exonuclease/phosphatase family metal-dependent hydrolase
MQIKLVSWNMDHWKTNKVRRREAWDTLLRDLAPDVALIQEAVPPPELASGLSVLWHEAPNSRIGGAGIISRWPLTEVAFANAYPGCLVVAEVALPSGHSLTVVSLYGLLEKFGRRLFSVTTLHRMLSDLTPLLVDRRRNLILGGDFNASLQVDEQSHNHNRAHAIFFERVTDFGLVDCLARFRPFPVQTWRPRRGLIPWQLDYLFVNARVIPTLTACDVLDAPSLHPLSDHNPLVATFDFS